MIKLILVLCLLLSACGTKLPKPLTNDQWQLLDPTQGNN